MSTLIRLDDRDSRITYNPASDWRVGGGDSEYQKTTMGTAAAGARMSFSFTGSYIAVYGTITHNLTTFPISNTFTLTMSGKDITHSSTLDAAPVVDAIYAFKMYESPRDMEYGLYTLVMNVGVKDSETWIDYLEFNQTDPNANSRTSTSSSPSSPPNSTPTSTTGSGTSPGQLPTQSKVASESTTQTSIGLTSGAIAGIVIGVIALLVATSLLIWWKKLQQRSGGDGSDEKFTIDPNGNGHHTAQYYTQPTSQADVAPYRYKGNQQRTNMIASTSSVSDPFASAPAMPLVPVPHNEKRALRLANDVPPSYSV
ncbi:hypothetical protein PQX77_018422 [Marasmius sp. AFHP31]|nr:hypothetical protein PQX77_018422 [Marasmius sp. AFHP31]